MHIKISNFLVKSDDWAFLKNSIFEVFWPILYGKKLILRFSIFWMNQKILSIFQKILRFFWKNSFLKIFTSILTHFEWKKLILRFWIFWMNQKILSIFQKILSFFEKIHFWKFYKCFDPFCMGKIDFEIFGLLDKSEDS